MPAPGATASSGRWRGWRAGSCLSGSPTYYTVNLTSDTGASSGTDAYPVTGTPSGDLLWAITQANANTNPAGSVIEFDPTIFATTQTITLSSTLELSESAGPEVIDGPSAGVVVSGNNAVEVFQIDGGVTGTLAGLTISGGSATYGDAISNYGSLTVSGSTIEGNSGGGISNNGSLTVTGTTIEGNTSGGSGGGGLFNVGTTTITGCTIEDNSANGQWGGGGILNGGGTLTVTDSTFAGNSSDGIRRCHLQCSVRTGYGYDHRQHDPGQHGHSWRRHPE